MKKLAIGIAAALAFAGNAHAQDAAAPKQALSINPIGVVFTVFSGEYERSLSPQLSVGLSSSYWSFEDDVDEFGSEVGANYFSTDAKLRFYPSAAGLKGFAFGGAAGFTRLGGHFHDESGMEKESASALSVGVLVDYNWLLGKNDRFFLGTGIGAKRLFPLGIDEDGVTLAYPTLRFNVGWAL